MKRKITGWVLISLLSLSLIGCGKSEGEKELEAIQEELEDAGLGELADAFAEEEAYYEAKQKAYEEAKAEYVVFPKSDKWNTIEKEYGFQIDDIFIEYGSLLGDVMETINASSITYIPSESDYTEQKIVNADQMFNITFKRDDRTWFHLNCYNPTTETISANECIVYGASAAADAKPFSYVLGKSHEELMSITYEELETITEAGGFLEGYNYSSSYLGSAYYTDLFFGELGVDSLKSVLGVSLNYDMNANKMESYSVNAQRIEPYTKKDSLASLEGITLEDLENPLTLAQEALASKYEDPSVFTLKKALLFADEIGSDDEILNNRIAFIYHYLIAEGEDTYLSVSVTGVNRINNGPIEGTNARVGAVLSLSGIVSMEEAISSTTSYYEVLDEADF